MLIKRLGLLISSPRGKSVAARRHRYIQRRTTGQPTSSSSDIKFVFLRWFHGPFPYVSRKGIVRAINDPSSLGSRWSWGSQLQNASQWRLFSYMCVCVCDPKTPSSPSYPSPIPVSFLFANILFNAYQNLWISLALGQRSLPEFNVRFAEQRRSVSFFPGVEKKNVEQCGFKYVYETESRKRIACSPCPTLLV